MSLSCSAGVNVNFSTLTQAYTFFAKSFPVAFFKPHFLFFYLNFSPEIKPSLICIYFQSPWRQTVSKQGEEVGKGKKKEEEEEETS